MRGQGPNDSGNGELTFRKPTPDALRAHVASIDSHTTWSCVRPGKNIYFERGLSILRRRFAQPLGGQLKTGLNLGSPAAWPALEYVGVMPQAIELDGDAAVSPWRMVLDVDFLHNIV